MKDSLQERCGLFIENRDALRGAFKWESYYIYPLVASLFTAKGMNVDLEKMKKSRELIKEKTGIFSNFRGNVRLTTMTSLALAENPEEKIERILRVYQQLKEESFWSSEYLAVAAAIIADYNASDKDEEIVKRTRTIYKRMKESHPFLTTGEDTAFAALFAMSDLDDTAIVKEMENCYAILKEEFFSKNAVHSLSQVLSLDAAPAQEKCDRVMSIYTKLKEKGHKYGKNYELATLGTLALLPVEIETLIDEIIDVDDYLKKQKGFGALGTGSKQRLMYAGILTMGEHMPLDETIETAAVSSVIALVIAEQIAIIASMAAVSAAASSAANS